MAKTESKKTRIKRSGKMRWSEAVPLVAVLAMLAILALTWHATGYPYAAGDSCQSLESAVDKAACLTEKAWNGHFAEWCADIPNGTQKDLCLSKSENKVAVCASGELNQTQRENCYANSIEVAVRTKDASICEEIPSEENFYASECFASVAQAAGNCMESGGEFGEYSCASDADINHYVQGYGNQDPEQCMEISEDAFFSDPEDWRDGKKAEQSPLRTLCLVGIYERNHGKVPCAYFTDKPWGGDQRGYLELSYTEAICTGDRGKSEKYTYDSGTQAFYRPDFADISYLSGPGFSQCGGLGQDARRCGQFAASMFYSKKAYAYYKWFATGEEKASAGMDFCQSLEYPIIRAACIRDIAIRDKIDLCKTIENKTYRDSCIYQLNTNNLDPPLCESLEDATYRETCFDRITQDINSQDSALCESIKDPRYKDLCFSRITQDCKSVENAKYRDLCFYRTDDCNAIEDPKYRSYCISG